MPQLKKPSERVSGAAQKASSIGPDVNEGSQVIKQLGLPGISGMVGGLPDGLNPQAIEELLSRMNIPAADVSKAPVPPALRQAATPLEGDILSRFKDEMVAKYLSKFGQGMK